MGVSPQLEREEARRLYESLAAAARQRRRRRALGRWSAGVMSIVVLGAALVAAGLALSGLVDRPSDDSPSPSTPAPPLEPLIITITPPYDSDGNFVPPRFSGSYLSVEFELEPIETPGSELYYPHARAPSPIAAGTPILIRAPDATVSVFELQRTSGDLVEEGACIVPGAIDRVPATSGGAAFIVYVEWLDGSAGVGFVATVTGGSAAPETGSPSSEGIDARMTGLAVCEG